MHDRIFNSPSWINKYDINDLCVNDLLQHEDKCSNFIDILKAFIKNCQNHVSLPLCLICLLQIFLNIKSIIKQLI